MLWMFSILVLHKRQSMKPLVNYLQIDYDLCGKLKEIKYRALFEIFVTISINTGSELRISTYTLEKTLPTNAH